MSRYDKTAEYRMIDYLEKLGATLLIHWGDRHLKKGDFLFKYKDIELRIDHKSTRDDGFPMRIDKAWLRKLIKENGDYPAIPVVTISKLGIRDRWCLVPCDNVKGHPESFAILDPDHYSWKVQKDQIESCPIIMLGVDTYFMNVKVLLKIINSGDIFVKESVSEPAV